MTFFLLYMIEQCLRLVSSTHLMNTNGEC